MDTPGTHTVVQASGVDQYLTFSLGEEEYGLDILKVQEIKGYTKATPLPDSPPHVKGVINLRGTIIPVLDLRCLFSMEEAVADKATVVIVVMVADSIVGFLVDGVNDVLSIPRENIEQAPDLTRRGNGDFISGIGQHEERLVSLLEIDSLLGVGAKPL